MGQQQLLFIILVTLVVGFSTLVTLNSVDESTVKSGKEMLQEDIVRALGEAQDYYYKPAGEGGGGNSFHDITFEDLSLESSIPNGMYTIITDHQELRLVGSIPAYNLRIEAKAKIDSDGDMNITWTE